MTRKASPEPQETTGTARIMAPFALVIAILVVAIVIAGSVGGSDGDGGKRRQSRIAQGPKEDTYVVQSGDNLSVIASKYGIEASAIQQCNPDIDPQNLQPSLKIKLRC